jgi:hypothetical protein
LGDQPSNRPAEKSSDRPDWLGVRDDFRNWVMAQAA